MRKGLRRLTVLASALILTHSALACTDILIKAKDGTQLIARTLEFAMPLNSEVVTSPRGITFTNKAPNGKPGMSWKTKYGYLFVDALNQLFTVDGMNEQGLAIEFLYLPGNTEYQTVPAGKEANAIPYYYFGDWVLGLFKSVEEVKAALKNVYVFQQNIPNLGDIVFPVHAAIHDAAGNGIVVEFVKGEIKVHDFIGVMTNAPTYDWHTTNILQYENLSPYNPRTIVANGVAYAFNGQGAGMVGLPGDVSPASRFVKMAFMLHYAYPADNAAAALNLSRHIINNVDIPAGVAREKNGDQEVVDITQWTVFKDLTNKMFYYYTYNDMTMHSIDMSKLNFAEGAPRSRMMMESPPVITDMTSQLMAASLPKS